VWIEDLEGVWEGERVTVLAGGPGSERVDMEDLPGLVIGTNYAHRIGPTDFCVAVKPEIYKDGLEGDKAPSQFVVPDFARNPEFAPGEADHWEYKVGFDESLVGAPVANTLVSGRCGATGTAIHLAHLMGARSIFLVGVDLRLTRTGDYHAKKYWKTTKFAPMGWRQSLDDVERVFRDQAGSLALIGEQLRKAGKRLYYVSPYHWRHV
jgi:hypothetical protein